MTDRTVWDGSTGSMNVLKHTKLGISVAFSSDAGGCLCLGRKFGTVWDVSKGEVLNVLDAHQLGRSVAFRAMAAMSLARIDNRYGVGCIKGGGDQLLKATPSRLDQSLFERWQADCLWLG